MYYRQAKLRSNMTHAVGHEMCASITTNMYGENMCFYGVADNNIDNVVNIVTSTSNILEYVYIYINREFNKNINKPETIKKFVGMFPQTVTYFNLSGQPLDLELFRFLGKLLFDRKGHLNIRINNGKYPWLYIDGTTTSHQLHPDDIIFSFPGTHKYVQRNAKIIQNIKSATHNVVLVVGRLASEGTTFDEQFCKLVTEYQTDFMSCRHIYTAPDVGGYIGATVVQTQNDIIATSMEVMITIAPHCITCVITDWSTLKFIFSNNGGATSNFCDAKTFFVLLKRIVKKNGIVVLELSGVKFEDDQNVDDIILQTSRENGFEIVFNKKNCSHKIFELNTVGGFENSHITILQQTKA